jgi:hypothetical protein
MLLLCNDGEISKYTRADSRQRLGKHVPAATNTYAAIEVLLEGVSSTRSVPRSYKEENSGNQFSSVRKSVKKKCPVGREPPFREDLSPEAEE